MTISQIIDMPGLASSADFFERGYSTGVDAFPRARVRFTPRQVDPGLADSLSVAAAPIAVCVGISMSLVGTDGQVLLVNGRGLVADGTSHTWQSTGAAAFDAEAWLLGVVEAEVPKLIDWAMTLTSAAASGLIAAVVPPVPPTQIVALPPSLVMTPAQYKALFTVDELAAINASADPQITAGIAALTIVTSVDLTDAAVLSGIDRMVTLGLISADRAARIKTGQPPVAQPPATTPPAAN